MQELGGKPVSTLTIGWSLCGPPKANQTFLLCSMVIRGAQLSSSQIKLLPNEGLAVSVTNAKVKISGKWKARKNFMCVSKPGVFEDVGELLVIFGRVEGQGLRNAQVLPCPSPLVPTGFLEEFFHIRRFNTTLD